VSGQGNETLYFDLTPFAQLLRPGTNTLAVRIGNTWAPDWDDVAFDVSLRAVVYDPSATQLSMQTGPPRATTVSVQTPSGTVWQLESCDGMKAANWQLVQVFTNTTGTVQTIQDTGQNGRTPPASVHSRFYRLVPF